MAGVQFVHRRRQTGGPAPWQEAVDVLAAALVEGVAWVPGRDALG